MTEREREGKLLERKLLVIFNVCSVLILIIVCILLAAINIFRVVQENKTKMIHADRQVRRERYLKVAQFNNLVTKLAAFSVTNTLLIVLHIVHFMCRSFGQKTRQIFRPRNSKASV
jgi:hypothetical protein